MAVAEISVMYTVNITSGLDAAEICYKLQDSLASGDFLDTLRLDSGYSITNITNAKVTDISPYANEAGVPTAAPSSVLFMDPGSSKSGEFRTNPIILFYS